MNYPTRPYAAWDWLQSTPVTYYWIYVCEMDGEINQLIDE